MGVERVVFASSGCVYPNDLQKDPEEIVYLHEDLVRKPTGPYNRVCDNSLAKALLNWSPVVPFGEGVRSTVDWYFQNHDRERVAHDLSRALTERTHAAT